MARFCTKCGKPLEEGEVCSCTQAAAPQQETAQAAAPQQETAQAAAPQQETAQAAAQQQNAQQFQQTQQQNTQQFQQTQQAVAGFLGRTFGQFLNIIKHPVTAGREMILTGDCASAITLIVLQGIITAIFGAVVAKKLYSLIGVFMGGLSSLFGAYGGVKMPYAKIIFGTLLISIILSFVLAALLLAGNLIIKNSLNFKQMMAAAAIRSCVASLATVVAMIVFLIHPLTGALVFVTGTVWGFFIILLAMPLSNEKIRNKLPLTIALVFLIFAGITVFSMNKGANLYVPSEEVSYDSSWWD